MAPNFMTLLLRWEASWIIEVTRQRKAVVLVIVRAQPPYVLSAIGHIDGDWLACTLKHATLVVRRRIWGASALRRAPTFMNPIALPGIIKPGADLLLRMNKEQTQHEAWPGHCLANI